MNVLGISAYYHDAAAAVCQDGEITAAAQEERFTRVKHDPSFPANAIEFCLEETGLSIDALDAVAFYDKPFLKFERILETFYHFAPRGLPAFIKSMPIWVKQKLLLKNLLRKELGKLQKYARKDLTLLFPEHHLSHAASAFYPSPFDEAAILTIDGVGEWATSMLGHGKHGTITSLKELHFPHSVGLLYSAFTYFLGFKVNNGEYKVMGLAPYGNHGSPRVRRFEKLIRQKLVHIAENGSIRLDQRYFSYCAGSRMVKDKQWEVMFGFPRRKADSSMGQEHADLALAIQNITEEIVIRMAKEVKRLTGAQNLCMAGGVALNCVANGKLDALGLFDQIFIQPAAGDAGGALGASLAASHIYFDRERNLSKSDSMSGALLGPAYTQIAIEPVLTANNLKFTSYTDFKRLCEVISVSLDRGDVVGWFQGRMEFGPRALGNRSILGDPRRAEMQQKLNQKIKRRESFRPFAPAVLEGHVSEFFDMSGSSPYMLLVHTVLPERRATLPESYQELGLLEKLQTPRSAVPAITHLDFSARIQSVDEERNPRFHTLVNTFYQLTGCPMLVNTSFNRRGEPIVCSPQDAVSCFLDTEMDHLVLGDYLISKTKQN